ncbi:hypothetical protein FQR65_LT07764 [Abscondita terminalis]|nr:hypothetical protein FQR65_LT07764 [Abscondita terminalis]
MAIDEKVHPRVRSFLGNERYVYIKNVGCLQMRKSPGDLTVLWPNKCIVPNLIYMIGSLGPVNKSVK